MKLIETDICIVGAGPVGLTCAYLANLLGLKTYIVDKSNGTLKVGRADALNARSLQLLDLVDLFDDLYPLGKPCNTSSVWKDGEFKSRQSHWWDDLEGCEHKHFLMIGQSFIEQLLDQKLSRMGEPVQRAISISDIQLTDHYCLADMSDGTRVKSRFIIGADGVRSFVRQFFKIPFKIERPQIIWAVIDGVIKTNFKKVPEIIVFQTDSSDVAWIPREDDIDRFYIRMDRDDFTQEEVLEKINRAMTPYYLSFEKIIWSSKFAVKESVAHDYQVNHKVFLAGDACHIHSVNGGQGLNTGLADAFNLIWKLKKNIEDPYNLGILDSYQSERRPVAEAVIKTSGELVRSTKYSHQGTHAEDYVKIVEKRADYITGMGIRYSGEGMAGLRMYDFQILWGKERVRLYSLLNYGQYTLAIFSEDRFDFDENTELNILHIPLTLVLSNKKEIERAYDGKAILIRPDAYIAQTYSLSNQKALRDLFQHGGHPVGKVEKNLECAF
jgi:3-(3-hydroxy-phenyl)propionate hydroxylase